METVKEKVVLSMVAVMGDSEVEDSDLVSVCVSEVEVVAVSDLVEVLEDSGAEVVDLEVVEEMVDSVEGDLVSVDMVVEV